MTGVQNGTAISEKIWQFLTKLNIHLPYEDMATQKIIHKYLWQLYSESPKIGNNPNVY